MEDLFQQKQQATNRKKRLPLGRVVALAAIVAGVFLIGAVLFYVFNKNFNQDELVEFIPVDAVVYFYARNSALPWQEEVLTNLPYQNFYHETQFDFAEKLLPLSTHTAYARFLTEEALESVWIFKLKSPVPNSSLALQLPDFETYGDGEILVVGSSQQALDAVGQVVAGDIYSLKSQNGSGSYQSRLLINSESLAGYLDQSGSAENKIYSQMISEDLDLIFEKNKSAWLIESNRNFTESGFGNLNLISELPEDFDVFMSGISLTGLFQQWLSLDSLFLESIQESNEVYGQIFNFELPVLGQDILNTPLDLVIFAQDSQTALGIGYVAVLPEPSQASLSSLEEFIKIILAQKLPQKAIRYLPDGTSVTELSANINAWQWTSKELAGNQVRYLEEPELRFGFYYAVTDGKLVLSNLESRMSQFINNSGISLEQYKQSCPQKIFKAGYVVFAPGSSVFSPSLRMHDNSLILGNNSGCIVNF